MRLPRSVAVIACAALTLVSCSSGAEEATVPSTTIDPPPTITVVVTTTNIRSSTTAPPSTTARSTEATVLAAYEEYSKAQTALFTEPDLTSPAFDTLMTGRQREVIRQRVQERLDGSYRLRFPAGSVARRTSAIESMTPTAAVLVSCTVDDSYRFHLDTGEITNTEVMTRLSRVDLVIENGRWKVEWSVLDRSWDGVAGCAA